MESTVPCSIRVSASCDLGLKFSPNQGVESNPSKPKLWAMVLPLQLQLNGNRAVVRAMNVSMDDALIQPRHEAFTDKHVVQPPANILLTGASAVTPPAVPHFVWFRFSVAVYQRNMVKKMRHAIDFFLSVSGCFIVIGKGTSQIDGLVSYVQITAANHGLIRVQFADVIGKSSVPLLSEWKSLQT